MRIKQTDNARAARRSVKCARAAARGATTIGRRGRRVRRWRLTRQRYAASRRRRRNLMFNDITLIGAVTESALTINLRVCLSCHRPGPPSPPNLDLCAGVCVCAYNNGRVYTRAPAFFVSRSLSVYGSNDKKNFNIYNARIAVFSQLFLRKDLLHVDGVNRFFTH